MFHAMVRKSFSVSIGGGGDGVVVVVVVVIRRKRKFLAGSKGSDIKRTFARLMYGFGPS